MNAGMRNLLGCLCAVLIMHDLNAQGAADSLDTKQKAVVLISAFTAKGDQGNLQRAMADGLKEGLTINEIKEVLVQLYAYTGFPRSLNALNTFNSLLKGRKSKGITDPTGREATPIDSTKNKLAFGTQMQTKLVGRPVTGEVFQFAPAIDLFLKEHLFGDIFGRDNLDWKTRELATIAALATLGGVESQLQSHLSVGKYNGLLAAQLKQTVSIVETDVKAKVGNALFPKGSKITNNNFTGSAWLQMLVINDTTFKTSIGNVTFEPGARTNWHYHPGGQILLVTDGIGRYQEKGKPVKEIRAGDIVKCEPNIQHWHGAARDSKMSHLAIGTNLKDGAVVWLQPVTDKEYNN